MSDKFKFFLEPSLQELYRDKDTGLPLAAGYIEFYRDIARTQPKPVYKLSGTPGDPEFVELPNPLPLTGIGSASDGVNNDIKFYYFPFDEDGNQDLYFIKVFNSSGVEQFTREGWPQQIDTGGTDSLINDVENYIENGQFLLRRLTPVGTDGLIMGEVTNVAFGGWIYQKPPSFISQSKLTFTRYPDPQTNPSSAPRYQLDVELQNPNPAETVNDLKVIFNRVDFLSNKEVTLQFEAMSNTGLPLNVDIYIQKNYGAGGSPEIEEFITTFTVLPTSFEKYKNTFTVSGDDGKVFGSNDDDEVRVIFRLPTDISFNFSSTNYMLVLGPFENNLDYPVVSNYQEISGALAGAIEIPDTESDEDIGSVLTISSNTETSSGQFGVGISNLAWLPAVPVGVVLPILSDVVPEGFYEADGRTLDIVTNTATPESIRLFETIGQATGLGDDSFSAITNPTPDIVEYTPDLNGIISAPIAHTSGFSAILTVPGTPTTKAQFRIGVNLVPSASSYFEMFAPTGRSTVLWFSVDDVGFGPPQTSFPGSLIKEIAIISTDTINDVAQKIIAQQATQYRLPDGRGMFIRGWDHGRGQDPDAASRTKQYDPTNVVGDVVGSVQDDALQEHYHVPARGTSFYNRPGGSINDSGNGSGVFVENTGGIAPGQPASNPARIAEESRSVSFSMMFIIKN